MVIFDGVRSRSASPCFFFLTADVASAFLMNRSIDATSSALFLSLCLFVYLSLCFFVCLSLCLFFFIFFSLQPARGFTYFFKPTPKRREQRSAMLPYDKIKRVSAQL